MAHQFCTFYLDEYYFGIEVENVREVLPYSEPTPVPLSESAVAGLINLRGQILLVLDLRQRLEMEPRPIGEDTMNLVVCPPGYSPTSLIVDRIDEVVIGQKENFETCPQTLQGVGRELIRGAYKLNENLMLELHLEKVVNFHTNLN